MKYIVTVDENGLEEIFTFSDGIDHDMMAEAISRIRTRRGFDDWERTLREPISAGFVSYDGVCFGKSITLKLSSREEDTKLLAKSY